MTDDRERAGEKQLTIREYRRKNRRRKRRSRRKTNDEQGA